MRHIFPALLHRLFHRNAPYSLIGLFAVLFILVFPILIDTPLTAKEVTWIAFGKWHHPIQSLTYTNAPPVAVRIFGMMDWIFGSAPLMRKMAALAILFFQVMYFSGMIVRKKIFESPTYIPALVMGMLVLFSFDNMSLTPDLFASVFLLLALEEILGEVSFGADRRRPAFKAGLCLGMASLCVFWDSLYLIAAIIVLAVFAGLSARKAVSLVLAFLFPHLLILILLTYFNCAENFIRYYYIGNFYSLPADGISRSSLFWVSLVPACFLGISCWQFLQRKSYSLLHSQATLVMIFWMITSLAVVSISEKFPHLLVVCAPPISLLITTCITGLQKRRQMEIFLWIYLLTMSFSLYWWRYNPQQWVDYTPLYPTNKYSEWQGKKILALCSAPSVYLTNEPCTALFNWEVSEKIFRAPQYYENQVTVADELAKDPPQIIIDPENLLAEFSAHQPKLRELYKKKDAVWILSN